MSFKRISYGGEGRFKIKVEDESGSNLGNWTIMFSDLGKWVEMAQRKYGIKIKKDRDLDWAK